MASNHKLICARAARTEFVEAFCQGIQDYRSVKYIAAVCGRYLLSKLPDTLPFNVLSYLCDRDLSGMAWDGSVAAKNDRVASSECKFRVMVRKRPLHVDGSHETNQTIVGKEGAIYDSVSIENKNSAVVVHDGRVHRDGRTLYMSHSRFCFDGLFSECASNQEIYTELMPPLVAKACNGGRATMLLFGQTGTGKTYTAAGVLELLSRDLFSLSCNSARRISVCCYEIAGSHGGRDDTFDLLSERKRVKCLTGEDGNVHVRGAHTVACMDAKDLREAISTAMHWRSSESTERNVASSRSHAIIEIHIGSTDENGTTGVLRIVDLAGSERNFETQQHTRKMAERGGHINYSLLMLKDCARIMHRNQQRRDNGELDQIQHIPFRRSGLTHLLKECFTDEAHRAVVLATLSPSPVDVEHTLNTLQHVGMMRVGRWTSDAFPTATHASTTPSKPSTRDSGNKGFSEVQGRGRALHSSLQDARQGQLDFKAFEDGAVGGTIMKKYEPENVKKEAFIDPRYHREMNVIIEEDLWVLKDADAEVVQLLTSWREQQWNERKVHHVSRWDAAAVAAFVKVRGLQGRVRIPSAMTGSQLCRLSQRNLASLCLDGEAAAELQAALAEEKTAAREAELWQTGRNAKMAALGNHQVHVVFAT